MSILLLVVPLGILLYCQQLTAYAEMALCRYVDRPGELRPARPPAQMNPLLPKSAQAALRPLPVQQR